MDGTGKEARPAMRTGFAVRAMRAGDVEAVAAIETSCFAPPWDAEAFREAIASPLYLNLVGDRTQTPTAHAHDKTGEIAGYLSARVIDDEAELFRLAVRPQERSRGLGTMLLQAALGALAARGVKRIHLEVRASNHNAMSLYRGEGFQQERIRILYYQSPPEDAVVMSKRI